MSNTPAPQSGYPTCKNCDEPAHYVIGSSYAYGPQSACTLKPQAAKYCLRHANERAAELLPAWKARRETKLAENRIAHAEWKARRDSIQQLERSAIATDRTEQRSVTTLAHGDVVHFTGGYRRSVSNVEHTDQGVRVTLSNGVRTTFLVTEVVAVEVN